MFCFALLQKVVPDTQNIQLVEDSRSSNGSLENLENENIQIAADSLLFSCELINNSDHIILNKVSADLLRQTQANMSQHENFNGYPDYGHCVAGFSRLPFEERESSRS